MMKMIWPTQEEMAQRYGYNEGFQNPSDPRLI